MSPIHLEHPVENQKSDLPVVDVAVPLDFALAELAMKFCNRHNRKLADAYSKSLWSIKVSYFFHNDELNVSNLLQFLDLK